MLVAALRIFYHDGTFLLIWLNAFTRYIYLPVYVCAAWAVWQRRWLLALAGVIVAGFHIAWMAPDFLRDRRFEVSASVARASADDDLSPTLRIFFANVKASNREHDAMLQEIVSADPDVIVLVEYGWSWHRAFKASPVLAPYKFGTGHLQSHIGSVNVFSKLPLTTEIQNWVTGRATHTIDLALGSQTLRIIGLHGPRPLNLPRYNYRQYWEMMLPLLTMRQGPLVIVGDFNVTEHSRVYAELTAADLRSAHDVQGRGYATTWPNGKYWLPPIRIDQVFLSPEVQCRRIVEGIGRGSDHKPLILDVQIREPSRSESQ
jgi:endonuclease/exonuclease/phosphatase (EEP) superfamily protein YafD